MRIGEGEKFAAEYQSRIPFVQHLGIRVVALADGLARLSLALKPEFTNSFATAHGGVIMTLLDVALCIAARTQHPGSAGIMTLDMATSFIGPGRGTLLAEGRVLKPGRSTIYCEAEIRSEDDGVLVAKALGTVRVRPAGPDPG